jgi:hypothetical protein
MLLSLVVNETACKCTRLSQFNLSSYALNFLGGSWQRPKIKQVNRIGGYSWRNSKTGWGRNNSVPCAIVGLKTNNADISGDWKEPQWFPFTREEINL